MDIKQIATKETPEVIFNASIGSITITGRSLPENATEFYEPLMSSVFNYIQNPRKNSSLLFNLSYYNTATSKILVKLLMCFEPLPRQGFDVSVKWMYQSNDDIMREKGEEIKSVVFLPFELIEF